MALTAVRDIIARIKVMAKGARRKLRSFGQRMRTFGRTIKSAGARVARSNMPFTLQRMGSAASQTQKSIGNVNSSFGRFLFMSRSVNKSTGAMTKQFTGFRMEMLSVMFAGMALLGVFGSMSRQMLSMTGAGTALGSAMKVALMPMALALLPVFLSIADTIMNMSRGMKLLLGGFVILMTILGALLMMVGQVILFFSSLALMFGITAAAIIGTVVAAITVMGAVFMTVVSVFRSGAHWIWKVLTVIIVGAILLVIGFFASVPVAVAGAIAAVIGIIVGLWDEIKSGIDTLEIWWLRFKNNFITSWRNIKNSVSSTASAIWKAIKDAAKSSWDFFSRWFGKIVNMITSIPGKALQAGKDLVTSLAEGVKAAPGKLIGALKTVIPDWLIKAAKMVKEGASTVASGVSTGASAIAGTFNDFIAKDGKIAKFDKNDTILGLKNPAAALGGGGGTEININNPELRDEIDIDALVERIETQLDRNITGRTF